MVDTMVEQTQIWLNETYGGRPGFGSVTVDGQTGWNTIYALTRALQIELGITETANNFGPGTQARFQARWPSGIQQQKDDDKTTSNVYGIIQGALWCKGYSTGSDKITTNFYGGTGNAIRELKSDMGIGGDSSVGIGIMKALLSMDQFVLLAHSGGRATIRQAQQKINREYQSYVGIIPTDGLYGREMNTALITVLQAIEGFSPDDATGYFGNGTRSRLKTINSSNALVHSNWLWLGTVALACNGYRLTSNGPWNESIVTAITQFQHEYKLELETYGEFDPTTWMSLLTSKGDPDRPCVACDTRFEVTDELIKYLKADGYQIVGRYLTEPGQEDLQPSEYFKAIRPGELQRIVAAGLGYFPIFQENSRELSDFTPMNGVRHAREARTAAERLGIPPIVIYFAVDLDVYGYQVDEFIEPYFKAVKGSLKGGYGVGIYASRNVCSKIASRGYTISSFVSDMSSGFSGNLGYPIPTDWNYDQFTEIDGYRGGWDLDRVAYSGKDYACREVMSMPPSLPYPDPDPVTPDEDPLLAWTKKTERECLDEVSGMSSINKMFVHRFILEWLRKPEYWTALWKVYTPELYLQQMIERARTKCIDVCDKQPQIKGTLPNRDIAHMAATTLGYMTWGVEENYDTYGLGDLGGWPLDLLQIWGNYTKEDDGKNLASWFQEHLGSMSSGKGFGYEDVLADADAWLIARYMKHNPSHNALTAAMRNVFAQSETRRIVRFYYERFGANADNVVKTFRGIADGIDVWGFENFHYGKIGLLEAAKASRLPSPQEAEAIARAYAAFLEMPHR